MSGTPQKVHAQMPQGMVAKRAKKAPATPKIKVTLAASPGVPATPTDRLVRATHKGSFKKDFGIDVDCYVLDNPEKTAVITQTAMARALGLPPRGHSFPRFVASKMMSGFGGTELREKTENPVRFQSGSGGTEIPLTVMNGFDVTLLIDVCNAIIAAEARGNISTARYGDIIKQAHIIVGSCAKSGITRLVYDLSGYNPSTEEVIAAFKAYVQEEARKYESEFPSDLYKAWHRLYEIPVPERGKPWHFKHLTVRHIYHPLAKSRGRILVLVKALKAKDGDSQKKLFQFLNGIGARALSLHIGRVLEMAESSPDRQAYESKIVDRFGGQLELDMLLPNVFPPANR